MDLTYPSAKCEIDPYWFGGEQAQTDRKRDFRNFNFGHMEVSAAERKEKKVCAITQSFNTYFHITVIFCLPLEDANIKESGEFKQKEKKMNFGTDVSEKLRANWKEAT